MKKNNDDSAACRDGSGVKAPVFTDSLEECRLAAASVPLTDLVAAHKDLWERGMETRRKIVAGALKRRFGVTLGIELVAAKKGGTES